MDLATGLLFRTWFLTKTSISLRELNRVASMDLTLPASKTDPFRQGITLTIAASQDEGCPVHAMRQLIRTDTHRPPSALLFCIGRHEQQPFTREHVVRKLQGLAIQVGMGHGAWNGHSFRREAATWATQVRIAETDIQTLGRWRSDAYKAYIDYRRKERLALSQRFQRNRVSHSN